MFDYFKKKAIENRANDEILYEYVTEELEKNIKAKGLWAKAYANSDGNDNKIEPLYMQYRVQSIKDIFASLEIMYNELSRQKLFEFISNGFKENIEKNIPKIIKKKNDKVLKGTKFELESEVRFEIAREEYLEDYNRRQELKNK